jgi:hypothetical protein
MVRIILTIKYVEFTYSNVNFELEVYNEQWDSVDFFKTDLDSGGEGFKPLPHSTIELV